MFEQIDKELIVDEPKPFESCHASHLALLPNGDVLAVWFGGSREGADDVAIWCSRRENGKWGIPFVVADEPELPHWNPVLFARPDGTLLLFYKVGRQIKSWYTKWMVSSDLGRTWTRPVELVDGDRGGRGPVRNKLLVLSDGTWLAPASSEDGMWKAFVDVSTDQGKSWARSEDIEITSFMQAAEQKGQSGIPVSEQSFAGRGVIQPTLWESKPGTVHMMLRSSEGRIYRSDSTDYGKTWCAAYATDLPNNNSGIDVAKTADGSLVLIYNPVGINWGPRSPLVLRVSKNNGATWGEQFVLEDGAGEYSYPAILADGDDICLTYTWRRENIAFCKLRITNS
ncbi:neuraminidase (sialidase) [Gordoniibacillus kamchatkensis]|uniref:Neuraminidase (Sialidase) n=1 Tax=Gordoniibacillus kamchatkensis TaxID=1590651 RepID=A0ABR5AK70_9BACL|nr:sialidase family protein [Paenibacillus sp. VKM B-2647]KIL41460.1 neuraminidase (sialidase) [Paenibacillus sp. VKM B-2647]